jgi:hypothetical protein
MIANTLFVRVVPQDKDRGYMLLAGFDSAVIQRTAAQYITLSDPSRASLNSLIEVLKKRYNAAEVRDVTSSNILRRLAKKFGES